MQKFVTELKRRRRAWMDRRAEEYDKPIESAGQRRRLWLNMIFADHGLFRFLWLNQYRVGRDAWRAAQPAPHHIRRFRAQGIKSVVNLRGGREYGSLPLEREACAREELQFESLTLRSRMLLPAEDLLHVVDTVAALPRPVLFHCKSGADRAGFMAALWLALVEERPIPEARKQLSLWFGHVKQGNTGVLDAFFDAYERDNAEQPISLRDWISTRYDPVQIQRNFKASGMGQWVTDTLLRRE